MNEALRIQLSAYVDGELPDNEKELLLRRLSQDASLREQVAEYLAIGHAIRGDVLIGGVDGVRSRVNAALGDGPSGAGSGDAAPPQRPLMRPVAGVAVAAAVALIAILGLQRTVLVGNDGAADATADATTFPTQPDADDLLRQYRLMHAAGASENGAHSIRTRLTGFELRRDDTAAEDDPAADEPPVDAPGE